MMMKDVFGGQDWEPWIWTSLMMMMMTTMIGISGVCWIGLEVLVVDQFDVGDNGDDDELCVMYGALDVI